MRWFKAGRKTSSRRAQFFKPTLLLHGDRADPGGSSRSLRRSATSHWKACTAAWSCPAIEAGFWRQWWAFSGPAMLVSVGYMDPGNWGTDLQGGAQFK